MPKLEVIPGLILDDAMFDLAAAAIQTHAPDLPPLTFQRFTSATGWWMIPDDDGNGYKAELTLRNDREKTYRLNNWFLPDLRGGQQSRPHSHPWPFTARIISGGYAEDRYEATRSITVSAGEPTVSAQLGVEHLAGGHNDVPRSVYHEVTDIFQPGNTFSLMVCGRGERGQWGYLNTSNGQHTPTAPDPNFQAKLRKLNPHQY